MNRIRELISSAGITSKELSIQTGIPYDSLKNYEYGRREPTGKALVALEQYFNVSGAYILGEDDETKKISAWEDPVIMNSVFNNLPTLMQSIIKRASSISDEEQKQLFDILVELRHITELDDEKSAKRTEAISFIHDTISHINKLI